MAKIKLPSYIKEGHGRMDDAVIVTRNGVPYMMPYRKRSSRTERQEEIRRAFSTVVEDWKYVGGIISDSWVNYTKGTKASGYNAFVGANVTRRRAGDPLELSKDMGCDMLINFTAAPGSLAGEIICEFLSAENGRHITFFVRREMEPGVKSCISRHDADADAASPFTISGLESGAKYYVYAVVTDAQYDKALMVSSSVAASVIPG